MHFKLFGAVSQYNKSVSQPIAVFGFFCLHFADTVKPVGVHLCKAFRHMLYYYDGRAVFGKLLYHFYYSICASRACTYCYKRYISAVRYAVNAGSFWLCYCFA